MVDGDVAMQGFTGTDGAISFMMFPAIQYGITVTNATLGVSKYVSIYPQDNDYVIRCVVANVNEEESHMVALYNSTLYVSEPSSSEITWNLYYDDPQLKTYHLVWNITCLNNGTVMYDNEWSDGAYPYFNPISILQYPITDNYTFPAVPAGVEYRATYDAERRT